MSRSKPRPQSTSLEPTPRPAKKDRGSTNKVSPPASRDLPLLHHDIAHDIAGCRFCPSMRPWRKFGPEAYGTRSTGYLLVGEAPGYGSWKNGRRFTGPAGLLIRRALRQVGDPRYQNLEDLVYMTDIVKCHPAPRTNPTTNRAPLRAEIAACGDFLVKELELLRPTVILSFGKVAAEQVQRAIHAAGKHVAGAGAKEAGEVSGAGPGNRTAWARPEVLAFPHPSPRNQWTIRKRYPSMSAFESALTATFRGLIAGLHRTGSDA